jgi:hypothetical protein
MAGKPGPIDERGAVTLYLDDPLVPPALQVIDLVRHMPGQQGAEMAERRTAAAVVIDQLESGTLSGEVCPMIDREPPNAAEWGAQARKAAPAQAPGSLRPSQPCPARWNGARLAHERWYPGNVG